MDNLQQYYMLQFAAASEIGLHGDIQRCLDICFDLRLKPDLAFFTRALVNLTLADLLTVQEHSDKSKFAKEAYRIAKELQTVEGPSADAVWSARYVRLKQDAEQAVRRTIAEEVSFAKAREETQRAQGLPKSESGALAEKLEELNLASEGEQRSTLGPIEEVDVVADSTPLVPWEVEGTFTFFPTGETADAWKEIFGNEPNALMNTSSASKESEDGAQVTDQSASSDH